MRAALLSFGLAGGLAACGDSNAGDGGMAAGTPSDNGGAAQASAPAAGSCGQVLGALRGKSAQTVTAGGLQRSFIYYAPEALDPALPAPVVIVAHGYTMSADMMFDITEFSALADQEGFVVLYPNGQPNSFGPWNVGSPDCSSTLGLLPLATGDDQAFVDAMLQFVESDRCVDHDHVFMTGFSMGGYFSNEVGCQRSDIRAIAPHSGGSHDLSICPGTLKPVLLMHFENDALIPFNCGTAARDRWVQRNGCQVENPEIRPAAGGQCEYYRGCQAGGQVTMCSFTSPTDAQQRETFPGHAWSGGSKAGAGAPFAVPETESATLLVWDFFEQYAW